jgi:hypothetical protein
MQGGDAISFESVRALFLAVIQQAIHDWRDGRRFAAQHPRGARAREARAWLFDDDHGGRIGFSDACAALGIEVAKLRAALPRYAEMLVEQRQLQRNH